MPVNNVFALNCSRATGRGGLEKPDPYQGFDGNDLLPAIVLADLIRIQID
jgi:hypothetical protein